WHTRGPETQRGVPLGRPDWFHSEVNKWSIRHRALGVGREGRIGGGAAQQVHRRLERLVVLGVRRDVGLRTGLLVALGLDEASPLVSVRAFSSSGTSCSTSMSGLMPLAWIEVPDGVK